MLNVVMLSDTFYAECSYAECLGAREKKQSNEIKSEREMKGFERKEIFLKQKIKRFPASIKMYLLQQSAK
jgi:hypothetical protein